MTDPPCYPGTGSTDGPAPGGRPARRARWKTAVIVAAVIALLAVMIILHVTGRRRGGH
jgi:hypothetical protein